LGDLDWNIAGMIGIEKVEAEKEADKEEIIIGEIIIGLIIEKTIIMERESNIKEDRTLIPQDENMIEKTTIKR
jgi:hypothetical protein